MNRYRALTEAGVGLFGEGVVELDLSAVEESDWLASGALEIVPRPYRVLSGNYSRDGWPLPQGAVVEMALPVELEASLGDHLERADPEPEPEPTKKAPAKRAAKAKE